MVLTLITDLKSHPKKKKKALSPFSTNFIRNKMSVISRIPVLRRHRCRKGLREEWHKTVRQTSKGWVGNTEMLLFRSSVTCLRHLGKRFWTPFRSYLEEIRWHHSRNLGSMATNCYMALKWWKIQQTTSCLLKTNPGALRVSIQMNSQEHFCILHEVPLLHCSEKWE